MNKLINILKGIGSGLKMVGSGIKRGLAIVVANTAGIIVVVALLTSAVLLGTIAWPMATEYLQSERRADARGSLESLAAQLEECAEEAGSYTDSSCPEFPQDSAEGHYIIHATTMREDNFTLDAVPKESSPQASDTRCQVISLNSEGLRRSENDIGRESLGCW